eukprot:scaffold83_cov246-Pinguiococcus_pyrenoidosus.AAC.4
MVAVDFIFGCQTRETKLFTTQVENGIMGLSMSQKTLIPQLKHQGIIERNAFSICFNQTGGLLTVGGQDPALNPRRLPVGFTPLLTTRLRRVDQFFIVRVQEVFVGQRSLGRAAADLFNVRPGCVLDSGTSDTYLPKRLGHMFLEAWREEGVTWPFAVRTVQLSREELERLPSITIVFSSGARLEIKPTSYMELSSTKGVYVPRIYLTEERGAILGKSIPLLLG